MTQNHEARMSASDAIARLSKVYETKDLRNGGLMFILDGYAIELHVRTLEKLVITFSPRSPNKWAKPATRRKAWGAAFVQKRGASGMHVKSDRNTWYRLPALTEFFLRARDEGLFAEFGQVMTYGGSMGGFGALSFAGVVGASSCLSYNPQINLGPSVRHWENRFVSANDLDWTGPMCDIDQQLTHVGRVIIVFDPYYNVDRKQAELIKSPHVVRMHLPFLGHRVPDHLLNLGLLSWLFDQCGQENIDFDTFYQKARDRRKLLRYRNRMMEHAGENHRRQEVIERFLPVEGLIGKA